MGSFRRVPAPTRFPRLVAPFDRSICDPCRSCAWVWQLEFRAAFQFHFIIGGTKNRAAKNGGHNNRNASPGHQLCLYPFLLDSSKAAIAQNFLPFNSQNYSGAATRDVAAAHPEVSK
jgi:hypothetical protein